MRAPVIWPEMLRRRGSAGSSSGVAHGTGVGSIDGRRQGRSGSHLGVFLDVQDGGDGDAKVGDGAPEVCPRPLVGAPGMAEGHTSGADIVEDRMRPYPSIEGGYRGRHDDVGGGEASRCDFGILGTRSFHRESNVKVTCLIAQSTEYQRSPVFMGELRESKD